MIYFASRLLIRPTFRGEGEAATGSRNLWPGWGPPAGRLWADAGVWAPAAHGRLPGRGAAQLQRPRRRGRPPLTLGGHPTTGSALCEGSRETCPEDSGGPSCGGVGEDGGGRPACGGGGGVSVAVWLGLGLGLGGPDSGLGSSIGRFGCGGASGRPGAWRCLWVWVSGVSPELGGGGLGQGSARGSAGRHSGLGAALRRGPLCDTGHAVVPASAPDGGPFSLPQLWSRAGPVWQLS